MNYRFLVMKRFPLIAGLAAAIIVLGGIFLFSNGNSAEEADPLPPPPSGETYEYYWGVGCPHCGEVKEFIENWEDNGKIDLKDMEIYNNRANAALLNERAKFCNLPYNQIGVPFLFTPKGECVVGDIPIINYFEQMKLEKED